MLRLTPAPQLPPPPADTRQGLCGAGRAPRPGGAACPAASVRCWRRRPTRPPSGCSTATASRWWSPPARPAAARSSHHMGREEQALAQARNNIDAWTREIDGAGLDAILITVSGLWNHGEGLRVHVPHRPGLCGQGGARRRACEGRDRIPRDARICRPGAAARPLTVAYHAACSLQHGQKVTQVPKELLSKSRLRGQRCAGRAFVLRLGRHLQHSAAGAGGKVARPQDRQYRNG